MDGHVGVPQGAHVASDRAFRDTEPIGQFADNTFFVDSGPYDIQLTGVAAIPEPEISVMLLVGGAFCAYAGSRRRRKAAPVAIAA